MFYYNLQWHLKNLCPNKCKHCYINHDLSKDLDYLDIRKAVENIRRSYLEGYCLQQVFLTGGDIFCYSEWKKAIGLLSQNDIKINIMGNSKLLDNEKVDYLIEKNIFSYQFSLDGLQKTHDSIRGEGDFERTIYWIKYLSKTPVRINVMFTVSDYNKKDLFPLIRFLDSLDIRLTFAFDFVVEAGHAADNHLGFDFAFAEEIIIQYLELKDHMIQKRSKVSLREKSPFFIVVKIKNKLIRNDYISKYNGYVSGCMGGLSHFTILNDGSIWRCRRCEGVSSNYLGNIITDNLLDIFNKSVQNHFEEFVRQECQQCSFASLCRGCRAIFQNNDVGCPFFEFSNKNYNLQNVYSNQFIDDMSKASTSREIIKYLTILDSSYAQRKLFNCDTEKWFKANNIVDDNIKTKLNFMMLQY